MSVHVDIHTINVWPHVYHQKRNRAYTKHEFVSFFLSAFVGCFVFRIILSLLSVHRSTVLLMPSSPCTHTTHRKKSRKQQQNVYEEVKQSHCACFQSVYAQNSTHTFIVIICAFSRSTNNFSPHNMLLIFFHPILMMCREQKKSTSYCTTKS